MTLNGLVSGSNQKSNREPVLALTADEIEDTLRGLQKQALATRVESGRVEKWRHLLYEAWAVSKQELSVLAELLLRGPQTLGDLRGRVSRMDPDRRPRRLRAVLQPAGEPKAGRLADGRGPARRRPDARVPPAGGTRSFEVARRGPLGRR